MYDIRQFKPVLYVVVLLGITGFAVAAEQPSLWVLSAGAVMLNAWLVKTGRFVPLPRWLANVITLLAMGYIFNQVFRLTATPILLIGQGLVLLQIIKLFEQRANRDYAQLLILSLLLVVAAAISTASLGFAVIMVAYLFLALYCCLLFHLKSETDKAKAAQTLPPGKLNEATLRQDQRYLPRSMRRLTVMVSVVSLACAVFVFLFFPRGAGAGMLGQFQLRPPEVLTGFSDEVQLNQVAKITQNNTPVATVRVERNGKLVESGSLRLRGATFDRYVRVRRSGEWQWDRPGVGPMRRDIDVSRPFTADQAIRGRRGGDVWRQAVKLEPIGAKALFALAGIRSFTTNRDVKPQYNRLDETLQRTENLNAPLDYEVESNNELTPPGLFDREFIRRRPASDISPEIAEFARLPEVCGFPDLATRRPAGADFSVLDGQIAENIERYFKTHFSYTLDLTDAAPLFRDKDPLAVFVSQTRRGHCEYFAGAMTLACQSLGLKSRMVIGFVTDEYNRYSEVFQVRQSHAHAWVEVFTPDKGWLTFDPTSGREFPPNEQRSLVQRLKHVFDWMEYKWANSVVAYDGNHRDNLIQRLDSSLVRSAYRSQENMNRLSHWWDNLLGGAEFWTVSSKLLAGLITLMAFVIVAAVTWFLVERHRIRRRAVRIGLDALPVNEQIRLARQLGFYEDMMDVLHRRRRIARPGHLTPREFTRSLSFLPSESYDTIDRLTRVYYRVRYGGARVQSAQQRRLSEVVRRLGEGL